MYHSNLTWRSALSLALSLASFGIASVPVQASTQAPDTHSAQADSSDSTHGGLDASEWAEVVDAYERARHGFFEVDGAYAARNHSLNWLAQFDGRGFTVTPAFGDWSWGLELQSYGFPGGLVHVEETGAQGVENDRLTYHWGSDLQEWYINRRSGLEHGYSLIQRPAGADSGLLTFTLGVRGGLTPVVTKDARGIRFLDEDGAAALAYLGLKVFDADGLELDASFSASASGIELSIDERDASYPLTIDPVVQQAYIKASNTDQVYAYESFGSSVAAEGNTLVVGAPGEDSAATGVGGDQSDNSAASAGAVYVFVRDGSGWSQQAYIKASNTGSGDVFGIRVAISGNTLVVSATGEESNAAGVGGDQSDNSQSHPGAAYVFVRDGGTWSQQAYLKTTNPSIYTSQLSFGYSVAVSGDTIVVGTPFESSPSTGVNGAQGGFGATYSGAAYVFNRAGTKWAAQAFFKASNAKPDDQFGHSVAISGDTIVVGAPEEDSGATGVNGDQVASWPNYAWNSGAAYAFKRVGSEWGQEAYLKAFNTAEYDLFGTSVAISGKLIAVGAEGEDSGATGINGDMADNSASGSGAAYVYVRPQHKWKGSAYLKASNTEAHDRFGYSIAASGDVVVVGAHVEDSASVGVDGNEADNSMFEAGAVYAYLRKQGAWGQLAYLKASNSGYQDHFGATVSISGNSVVVGAPLEDSLAVGVNGTQGDSGGKRPGAAYAFDLGLLFDCNGNGVDDHLDIFGGTSADCNGNGIPDECDLLSAYADIDGDGYLDDCVTPSLEADVYGLSVSAGGVQVLTMNAPVAMHLYLLIGSASGTSPGTVSGSDLVPLNTDSYLLHTATAPNQAPLTGSFGVLLPDPTGQIGQAQAEFILPPAFSSSLVGLTLHHAFVSIDLVHGSLSFVSNAAPLTFLP